MKNLFICILLLSSMNVFGQLKGAVKQGNTPPNNKEIKKPADSEPVDIAKNNAQKLKQSLKLNDKQYNDIYKAFVEYETNIDKTGKSSLPKASQFKKMNEYNKVRQEKLKSILTKEQYHNYIMSFP